MSYKPITITSVVQPLSVKLSGGMLMQCPPSVGDPCGYRYGVRCSKHPDYTAYFYSNALSVNYEEGLIDDAQKLINKCPYCKDDQTADYSKTRFPEGAEL
jgi:hypothetical protein